MNPYEIQYEIYKIIPPGYGVQWDRWFPIPYTMAFSIGRRLEDGRVVKGELAFDGMELQQPHAIQIIKASCHYLMRSFKELDPDL